MVRIRLAKKLPASPRGALGKNGLAAAPEILDLPPGQRLLEAEMNESSVQQL